jgi:hypothetical protein
MAARQVQGMVRTMVSFFNNILNNKTPLFFLIQYV